MKIEELVAGLKEQGLSDDEIKAELEKIKADIDAFLGAKDEKQAEEVIPTAEEELAKRKEVFGI